MTNPTAPPSASCRPPEPLQEEIEREQRAQAALAQVAVREARDVGTDAIIDAVDAATLARTEQDSPRDAEQVAANVGGAAAAVHRWRWPLEKLSQVRWDPMGTVIPVLAASPGAGASVVAAALADALHASRRSVMLIDTADPVRSGLSRAVRTEGAWVRGPHPLVRIRLSRRRGVLLGRVDTELPVISPGMVPSPPWWRLLGVRHDATVVDIAHDAWRVAANPLVGAGAWMRHGMPSPRPILVCQPSAPSLLSAEAVLARLDSWAAVGALAPVERLVVVGARRWPRDIPGVAGRRLSTLVDHAVFVPHDPTIAAHGITAAITPARIRNALRPVLTGLRLPPPAGPMRSVPPAPTSETAGRGADSSSPPGPARGDTP